MDANGHKFWLLADAADFALGAGAAWADGCLRLAGSATAVAGDAPRSRALADADLPPVAVDALGTWAWVDPEAGDAGGAGAVVAGGADTAPTAILPIPSGAEVRDLHADASGILRLAGALASGVQGVALADLRGRWRDPYVLETPGAAPDRVAPGWLLERATGRIWAERGTPISDLAIRARAGHIFAPHPEYADPPRLEERETLPLAPAERIADCAARPDGLLAVLVLSAAQARRARLIFVAPFGRTGTAEVPVRGFPSSIAWLAEDRIALLYPDTARALALDVVGAPPDGLSVAPLRHPLKRQGPHRLCRAAGWPAHVAAYTDGRPGVPRALHPISLPGYAAEGVAEARHPIDAGMTGTVWHRLVVEGDFPPGTGATVEIAAADATDALDAAPPAAHAVAHTPGDADTPRAAWIAEPSELPFHPGLLGAEPIADRRGAFTALVQRSGTVTREIAGRYARVTVTLHGNGQTSPRLAALRLYGGRFSLVRNYLPPVFHPPADTALSTAAGAAHPRDFADRHVAMFESVLTRLEDKVAAAPLLTDPAAAPEDALDWLAGWVGMTLRPGLPTARRRAMLANAMRLNRRRGTLGGLTLALDVASGGEVSRGGIVTLEDYRLRRVFATILGAELGTEYDPLLAGPVETGNSRVGATLYLGDADEHDSAGRPVLSAAQRAELAALYRAPDDPDAADAVRGFFARLAHRVTVLVHREMDETEFGLVRDVARQMTPAHVGLRVERASQPLILGLYSLVGVDTYLRPRPETAPVRLDDSILGEKDAILRLPTLDPRLELGDRS